MQQSNILVIGTGIAGLACAQTLLKRGISVKLVEASNQYGGRIKPLLGFSNRILEAGGQTIHHPDNDYFKMAQDFGAQLEDQVDLIGSIYDPIQKRMLLFKEFQQQYPDLSNSIQTFIDERDSEKDESVLERMNRLKYPKEFEHYFQGIFGAEYAASINQLSANGVGHYEHDMPMFVSDYEITNNIYHIDIITKYFKEAIEIIQYNKEVKQIELLDNQKVKITYNNQKDEELYDKIVCCVPITQVKKIQWIPQLSADKQEQLSLTGMEKGGKFFIKLNKFFLPHEEELFIPQFGFHGLWWDNSSEEESIIIGLIVQDGHQIITNMGVETFAQQIVDTINTQYNINLHILKCHFEDWGNTPFIEGLYSYPKVGVNKNYRTILAEPIQNKIYFAGEAYHPIYYQSIHGAYETGVKVGKEL